MVGTQGNAGVVVHPPSRLTADTPGYADGYTQPSLAALTGTGALLTFTREGGYGDIYGTVLDRQGHVLRSMVNLSGDGNTSWDYRSDAMQLSNGRIVLAWTGEPPRNLGQQGWTGEYFNNETLTGTPVLVRTDPAIDFDWGMESPHPSVNSDHFSVRWRGTITVPAGTYRFDMGSDDGSRLWIDDQLVIDRWDQCCRYWSRTVSLSAGAHQVRMEMHERAGAAWARLYWQQVPSPLIKFVVLDTDLNRLSGPTLLDNPAALTGNDYVSLTSDAAGRAVLTWMDYHWNYKPNLYYALVGADGAVITPATIIRSSQSPRSNLISSFAGYGNTTYRWVPPAGVDSALSVLGSPADAPRNGVARIWVKAAGRGATPATGVKLRAVLDPRLRYLGDTSGITPTISGQTVEWNLADLRLYDIQQFRLELQVTEGTPGSLLPVELQLTLAETDLTPSNNVATAQVRVVRAVYVPLLMLKR